MMLPTFWMLISCTEWHGTSPGTNVILRQWDVIVLAHLPSAHLSHPLPGRPMKICCSARLWMLATTCYRMRVMSTGMLVASLACIETLSSSLSRCTCIHQLYPALARTGHVMRCILGSAHQKKSKSFGVLGDLCCSEHCPGLLWLIQHVCQKSVHLHVGSIDFFLCGHQLHGFQHARCASTHSNHSSSALSHSVHKQALQIQPTS